MSPDNDKVKFTCELITSWGNAESTRINNKFFWSVSYQ